MARVIHCSLCGMASPRYGFANRMKWLREHRKRSHYGAFRASVAKGQRTRRIRSGIPW